MSNIVKLKNYLKNNNSRSLVINQVSEEIASFYLTVIKHVSKDLDLKINIDPKIEEVGHIDDLFNIEEINIFKMPGIKNIERILSKRKCIIFTDYKNYKKYQDTFESLNGYNYVSDIKYFFNNNLGIKNDDLINNCIVNPQLAYSEFSKYLVNEKGYIKDISIAEQENFILEIRKAISKDKKSREIKKIFFKIKEEAQYKKFSFLTF